MRLLLIEDNRDLAVVLSDFFESRGYVVDAAADGINVLPLGVDNE